MANYEVEIKSLLGNPENAEKLRSRLRDVDNGVTCHSTNKQLNHYFVGGDLMMLAEGLAEHLADGYQKKLSELAERASDVSVRTRLTSQDDKDGEIFIVVKASVDDTTSENGISRMEFEEPVDLTLAELDELVLAAGFEYQAKWSREREEYVCKGVNVCLDRNAGYGYLAEFEKVVDDEGQIDAAREEVEQLMHDLEVEELPQDRLARMFEHYNKNWLEYYGTEKVFVVE